MHRVRMNLRHWRENGWESEVLCVRPDRAGRAEDERLAGTVPADVRVHRVGAVPEKLAHGLGLSAIGLRAWATLAGAGDRLAGSGRFDLALFSTTAFPVMALGRRWQRRFGLPYVLDFQDPWATAPAEASGFRRVGAKHAVMRALHRRLERGTVPHAAGLLSVSPRYLELLRDAYPALEAVPGAVVPFGHSDADFRLAREVGRPWQALSAARDQGWIAALAAGRGGRDLARCLRALFALLAGAPAGSRLARVRPHFLGTGYLSSGNPADIPPLAAQAGVEVVEEPDRLPLLDALRTLDEADLLFALGSDDMAYLPSRLHLYLATDRPVLVMAPLGGQLAARIEGVPGVVLVDPDAPAGPEAAARLSETLDAAMALGPEALAARRQLAQDNEAAALAPRECALFNAALAHARVSPGGPADASGGDHG